jgi:hypothetical protein
MKTVLIKARYVDQFDLEAILGHIFRGHAQVMVRPCPLVHSCFIEAKSPQHPLKHVLGHYLGTHILMLTRLMIVVTGIF